MGRSIVFAALAALAVGVHAGGPRFLARLAYERSSILRGEVWRLLTTYVVHAGDAATSCGTSRRPGWSGWPSGGHCTPATWLAAAVAVAFGSSLGVLLLQPEVRVMTGLSGLLHGLLAAGAVAEVRRGERLAGLFLGLLAAKVAWEQIVGPLRSPPCRRSGSPWAPTPTGRSSGLLAGLAAPGLG